MKNVSMRKYVLVAAIGFVLLITGLALAKVYSGSDGIMRSLPYICVGIGAGVFGGSLGTAIRMYLLEKDPQAARQVEIDAKDERNLAISNRAKAKAFDLMMLLYSALVLAFALMQVDLYVILALIAAHILVVVAVVFYLSKYQSEM